MKVDVRLPVGAALALTSVALILLIAGTASGTWMSTRRNIATAVEFLPHNWGLWRACYRSADLARTECSHISSGCQASVCLAEFQLLHTASACVDVAVDSISSCASFNGVRAAVILATLASLATAVMQGVLLASTTRLTSRGAIACALASLACCLTLVALAVWSAALYQAAPRTTPPRPPSATFIGSVSDLYYLGSGFAMVAAAWPLQLLSAVMSGWAVVDNAEREKAHEWIRDHDRTITPAMLQRLANSIDNLDHRGGRSRGSSSSRSRKNLNPLQQWMQRARPSGAGPGSGSGREREDHSIWHHQELARSVDSLPGFE